MVRYIFSDRVNNKSCGWYLQYDYKDIYSDDSTEEPEIDSYEEKDIDSDESTDQPELDSNDDYLGSGSGEGKDTDPLYDYNEDLPDWNLARFFNR